MFSKKVRIKRSFFSLIELLIVIGIMGILTALILPQFSAVESDSKDTGCDYNNAGTLRYVTMFKSANGKYPTGFHTGLKDANGTEYETSDCAINPTYTNVNSHSSRTALADAADAEYLTSLKSAGIVSLAYGSETAKTGVDSIAVIQPSSNWYEDAPDGTDEVLMLNGSTFEQWNATAAADAPDGKVGKLIALYAAPTVDWDAYYDKDGGKIDDSKIGVALPGKCPWPEDGKLRYYICFFKVYANGDPAKLIGTCCPECGVLNAGAF